MGNYKDIALLLFLLQLLVATSSAPSTPSLMNKASNQLEDFLASNSDKRRLLVTSNGAPMASRTATLTVGQKGPILLQDIAFTDEIIHFGQERIPERVVHAKGAGAHGYFNVTHDISEFSKAKVFEVGTSTPVFVRFSTTTGERASPDTVRDLRGFAVKFYTEEGNWDLVGNNSPIFFIRDPMLLPSLAHASKRNPRTNLKDLNMFWDFISLRPETTHQICLLFSDRGIPNGFRFMDGFGSHTFKLLNANGEAVFCKFHLKTDQGLRNLPPNTAEELQGNDPDYATRDLFNAIESGLHPMWTMKIQIMSKEQAETEIFDPFDITKVWPHAKYPLQDVGKLVLDRNPLNFHAEVEQAAFSPSHLVPGIEPSPDKLLQGRILSYPDAQRHRLGTNFQQIPINCPFRTSMHNYQRDGPLTFKNPGDAPNYFPNSFGGAEEQPLKGAQHIFQVDGVVDRYDTGSEDNFSQVTDFWENVLDNQEKKRLVNNIAGSLKHAKAFIRERAIENFAKVHSDFGVLLRKQVDILVAKMK